MDLRKSRRNQDAFHTIIVFPVLLIRIQATADDCHYHNDLLGLQDPARWKTQKYSGPNWLKGIKKVKTLYAILRINDRAVKD